MQQRHNIPPHHPLSIHTHYATGDEYGAGIASAFLPGLAGGGDVTYLDADRLAWKEECVFGAVVVVVVVVVAVAESVVAALIFDFSNVEFRRG